MYKGRHVGPIDDNTMAHYALQSPNSRDPEYVQAVLSSYINGKLAKGRPKAQISYKLTLLEQELPQYAQAFVAVRSKYRLGPNLVANRAMAYGYESNFRSPQPALGRTASASASVSSGRYGAVPSLGGAINRVNTIASPSTETRPASARRSRTSTGAAAGVTAAAAAGGDEEDPPPPPYTRQDPEPESTRMLEERLAAEAAARLPADPTPSPRPSPRRSAEGSASASAGPSTAAPPSHQRRPSQYDRPDTPPREQELRQVWEESQFDEAKRASLAAMQEQQELEEAMRLSLAEAEAAGLSVGESSNAQAGPSTPSRMPPVLEENHHAADASSSSTGLEQGMNNMRIPGSWEHDLMDIQDDMDQTGTQVPLLPTKTGGQLGSNNPFLSSAEREQAQHDEAGTAEMSYSPPPPPAQPQYPADLGLLQPTSPVRPRQPSSSSMRDSPGSGYTLQSFTPAPRTPSSDRKPLPRPPSQHVEQYAPPEGPPPAHLRIVTPPATVWPDTLPTPEGARPSSQIQMGPPPLPPRSGTLASAPSSRPASFVGNGILSPAAANEVDPAAAPLSYQQAQESSAHAPHAGMPMARVPSSPLPPLPNGEDPLEMLRDFDTVFLVDDSTSMAGERWAQAQQALIGVAEQAARYDETGVDVYFVNSKRVGKELKTASDVEDLFAGLQPRGATPTGMRLDAILREYMIRLERSVLASPIQEVPGQGRDHVKPMNLIVVTDGVFSRPIIHRLRALADDSTLDRILLVDSAPTDDPESVLIACAKRLDRGDFPLSQVGVQFLQIGDDVEAREALQELDDGLAAAHRIRDMVDTVPYDGREMTAGLIIKTLLGGINRRLDRRGAA